MLSVAESENNVQMVTSGTLRDQEQHVAMIENKDKATNRGIEKYNEYRPKTTNQPPRDSLQRNEVS